jgi:hypothetical protein
VGLVVTLISVGLKKANSAASQKIESGTAN